MAVALLGLALAAGTGLLAWIEVRERRPREMQLLTMRFGADLTASEVEGVLSCVAGLPGRSGVLLDLVATSEGLSHELRAESSVIEALRGQLRGVVPSLRLSDQEEDVTPTWSGGLRLSLPGRFSVLRDGGAREASAALIGALQPLRSGERVLIRWMVRPARPQRLPMASNDRRGGQLATDHARALRAKFGGSLVHASGLVAIAATDPGRAAQLAGHVSAVMRARRSPHGQIRMRRLSARRLRRLVTRRAFVGGDLYGAIELSGLLGWPIDGPQLPGLVLGSAPQLMPSGRIPESGRVLGRSTWPGMDRPVAQPIVGGLSHTLFVGPSGVGKSTLISNLVEADMQAGRGCLVVDGKGDLAEDLLARVPEHRLGDVIVLDPGAGGPVPGLNVLGRSEDAELTADLVLGVFKGLYADSWGVRSSQWLRAGLIAVAHDPNGTLADLPFVFSDDAYRRRLVGRLNDPILEATFASFEAMSVAERAAQLASPLNKISELVGRRVVRAVLAQPEPKFDMNEVLARGKIVIVSLAAGKIGTPAARLLGALVVWELFGAIQARAALPMTRRTPFFAYIDEPKVLGDTPVPIDSIFELARGLGVGLNLSAQSLKQLPRDVVAAALTNAGSIMAFRQAADDAALLARELPGVDADSLQRLEAHEIVARVTLGPGNVAPPVTVRTLPPSEATVDPNKVRLAAAERYGADPSSVDEALRARHQMDGLDVPVGRQRRAS